MNIKENEMGESKDRLIIEVAKMYYSYNISQKDIAKTLGISKAYVCQLLDTARKEGFVEIRIKDLYAKERNKEEQLKHAYGLKDVWIFKNEEYRNKEELLDFIADAVGRLLAEKVKDNYTFAFSWGNTLYNVSKRINKTFEVHNVNVVPLSGSMNNLQSNIYVSEISTKFAEIFQGIPYLLPLPAIVENSILKEQLYQDRSMASLIEMMSYPDVAIFTVGHPGEDNLLYQSGYITKEELEFLNKNGLVGDLLVHFLNKDGELINEDIEKRTITCSLEKLKNVPVKICIAYDVTKAAVLKGALKKGYIDYLYVDEATAQMMDYF